jgi:hypothetical protein
MFVVRYLAPVELVRIFHGNSSFASSAVPPPSREPHHIKHKPLAGFCGYGKEASAKPSRVIAQHDAQLKGEPGEPQNVAKTRR